MIDLLVSLNLSPMQWILAAFCGLVVGISKTGLIGTFFLSLPILAGIFGSRTSTGVVLPMLILADLFAVVYYNRHANWKYLFKLMPFAFLGIFIALVVGGIVSGKTFSVIFALTILIGIVILIWRDLYRRDLAVPIRPWFSTGMGLVSGFATMIGNAAGPLMSLYLLSMRLPKDVFIGTGAWFYLTVNLVKVPLQVLVWKTITLQTLAFDLVTVPFIILGAVGGIFVVKRIPEKIYRVLVIVMVILTALMLVVKFLF